MKKIYYSLTALALIAAVAFPSLADTIRLKDGSVIRGDVVGFKDQQFVVLIGAGAKGRRSRTTIYVEDIESIEFDSASVGTVAPATDEPAVETPRTEPTSQPARNGEASVPRNTTTQPVSGTSPTFFTIRVSVKADATNNGWTNSGLVVRRGQRLKISASNRISLGGGRFATPAGVATITDN